MALDDTTQIFSPFDGVPTSDPTDVDRMARAMREEGFVLVSGLLRDEEVTRAREEIDRLRPVHWDFTGTTDHYKNVFNRDAYWLRFLDRPPVIDLARACLGEQCHVIGQTAWRSHPGHRGVGVHLDYLPMEWPEPGVVEGIDVPMFLCTAHYYFSPQHTALCPTQVVPGSHRAGRRPRSGEATWNDRGLQPVLCEAGSVLFFRSDLWHAGSDNTTKDETRYLLQVHYGRREMAHHFAPFLDWRFDPEVLAECTPTQRLLLGDHPRGAYD